MTDISEAQAHKDPSESELSVTDAGPIVAQVTDMPTRLGTSESTVDPLPTALGLHVQSSSSHAESPTMTTAPAITPMNSVEAGQMAPTQLNIPMTKTHPTSH